MIVVTDTSVVLNLCWLGRESLLTAIYQGVLAPGQVRLEFERKAAADPRFTGLAFPPFIALANPAAIPGVLSANSDLDAGEIAALALGLHVTGLLGVLIEGKQRQLVPALKPILDALAADARFWIAPRLRELVLRRVGETP